MTNDSNYVSSMKTRIEGSLISERYLLAGYIAKLLSIDVCNENNKTKLYLLVKEMVLYIALSVILLSCTDDHTCLNFSFL